MISRRRFLKTLTVVGGMLASPPSSTINRAALVTRHNPVLRQLDPLSPLTVGNGEFAFTADITGLQTLAREYENAMPLCTMSQWGWHTRPAPEGLETRGLRLTPYDTHGRKVGYQTSSEGQTELYQWLRENPHRLHLGQIGFCRTDERKEIQAGDLSDIRQELDLWRGVITSRFRLDGELVTVQTAVDPRLDVLAASIRSRLIDEGKLAVRFDFPYGSPSMRRTLIKTMKEWKWDQTWGWDYPLTAMTAARLGETAIAIDALLMRTEKNRYLPNGHNWQRQNLPCYLPGNGGLLYAIAMMAGGWQNAPRKHAPGFPHDGSWTVRWEGFNNSLLEKI